MVEFEYEDFVVDIQEHIDVSDTIKANTKIHNYDNSLNNKLYLINITSYEDAMYTVFSYGLEESKLFAKKIILNELSNIKLEEMNDYFFNIRQYSWTDSPREGREDSKLAIYHKRHNFVNETQFNTDNYGSWHELKQAFIADEAIAVILPVYMYEHSGYVFSTTPFGCKFDSGQVGYIFMTKSKAYEIFKCKRLSKSLIAKINEWLISDVSDYSYWCNNEVYDYILVDKDYDVVRNFADGNIYGYSETIDNIKKTINDLSISKKCGG